MTTDIILVGGVQGPQGVSGRELFDPTNSLWGCIGDNVANDGPGLNACIAAAVLAGGRVEGPAGLAYRSTEPIVVSGTCEIELKGSPIIKDAVAFAAVPDYLLKVTGDDVLLYGTITDGNRADAGPASGGGVLVTGARCYADATCEARNNAGTGWLASGAGASLYVTKTRSVDNRTTRSSPTGTIAAGSKNLAITGLSLDLIDDINAPIAVSSVGPGIPGAVGSILTTTIASITDSHHCVLASAATVAGTNVGVMIGTAAGNGFEAELGAVLYETDIYATGNDFFGSYLGGAGDGCCLDGNADRNRGGGWYVTDTNNGKVGAALSTYNTLFGFQMGAGGGAQCDGWSIDRIESDHIGCTPGASDGLGAGEGVNGWGVYHVGTGCELYGVKNARIGIVDVHGCTGYGLAIARNNDLIGSSDIEVGTLLFDHQDVFNSNPALHFSGKSHHNRIGIASIKGGGVALILGETTVGNDHNTIGMLILDDVSALAIKIDGGAYNSIGRVIARNCGNPNTAHGVAEPPLAPTTTVGQGLVDFQESQPFLPTSAYVVNQRVTYAGINYESIVAIPSGGNGLTPDTDPTHWTAIPHPTHHNRIEWLEYQDDSAYPQATGVAKPYCAVHCDRNASQNFVLDGYAVGMTSFVDENGGNRIRLRDVMGRSTQVATFESAESWPSTVDDIAAGHFVRGTQGKKLVGGSPGTVTSSHPLGSSQNYSAFSEDDWMRVFVFIANLSDANNASSAILVRFQSSSGNYYQVLFPANHLKNGGQYLYWRKTEMTTTGAPSWTNINTIVVGVFAGTATHAVTFDDLLWVSVQHTDLIPAVEALGDIVIGTGSASGSRLAVGTDGSVISADSTSPLGVKWSAAPPSGPPTGAAGGALTGTYPNPDLATVQDPMSIGECTTVTGPATLGTLAMATSNEGRYCRIGAGGYAITGIKINVGASSGNISVAVYTRSGSGSNAVPAARTATSGAVACPAGGIATVALGGSVTPSIGDFLFLSADGTAATFTMIAGAGVTLVAGIGYSQSTAHPAPSPAGTLATGSSRFPYLKGA